MWRAAPLAFCQEKKWPVIDVFQPLDRLQKGAQSEDDKYTMLRDTIHLTDPAYIAWGYFLYEGLGFKEAESELAFVPGASLKERGCKLVGGLDAVMVKGDEIRFTRRDLVLPILPPGPLPPRKYVPLETHSSYRLLIGGLKTDAKYELECEGKTLGSVSGGELSKGININTLVLDNGVTPPWDDLAKKIWAGKELDQVGKTQWNWRVVRK